MKYRKKPVEVEAFKWTGDHHQVEDPEWIVEAIKNGKVVIIYPKLFINTLEGKMTANKGDWIIKGVKGELYPVRNDIFEATYELVAP